MNDYSNPSWAFYSENLKLHIAATIRGLRLSMFHARLRFLRSFFEAGLSNNMGATIGL